jgi:hypothetical protein
MWARALAFYLLVAVITVGWHALGHPRSVCACDGTQDPASYMWALAWWPHAIVHGLNPFVTHYLWSPTGVNVAQGAMIPTAAILMAPVTDLVGPIASYNILSIAGPALAAFSAYLLCRRLVRRELPAVAGGYLFGFSSYELAQLNGHLNLTLIFLIPVMVHIALRRADREISRATYVTCMALLIVAQAGLSTELLAESVGLGAVALVSAHFLVSRPQRGRIDDLLVETIGAGLIAIALAAPFLYYALFSGSFPKGDPGLSDAYGLDLLNPFFPTYSTLLGHDFLSLGATYEHGNISEADGYLSIPIVLAFTLWLLGDRLRSVLARLLAILAGVSFLAALGSHLHTAGQLTVALPFDWVRHLPVFDDLLPSRIVVFTTLCISIGVAAWLAKPTGRAGARWALALVGAMAIFPNLPAEPYGGAPRNPRFFSTDMYRSHLTRGETVLALPFGENDVSMLWQAETGFYFHMPEGYVSAVVPAPFDAQPTVRRLLKNMPLPARALGTFIRQQRVAHVVVDPAKGGPWPDLLAHLGLHGRRLGGVLLYAGLARPQSSSRTASHAWSSTSMSRVRPLASGRGERQMASASRSRVISASSTATETPRSWASSTSRSRVLRVTRMVAVSFDILGSF